jgi:hypothetical protein
MRDNTKEKNKDSMKDSHKDSMKDSYKDSTIKDTLGDSLHQDDEKRIPTGEDSISPIKKSSERNYMNIPRTLLHEKSGFSLALNQVSSGGKLSIPFVNVVPPSRRSPMSYINVRE